ncbi:MAG: hypothetical protein CMK74_15915 [Pseudomonadales bacterium]|nr:hypothetical protein [Pseudomonadales bacterium]|tara:strand:+ start:1053 stop:1958 length:906 start_codon:yes stop_codon:yes gene_type:complete
MTKKITPADDQRHSPDSDALDWNESWVFYAIDPQQQLSVITRIGLMPNKGICNVTLCMSQGGKPLYHRYLDQLPLPEGDMLTGISAGGLSIRALSLEQQHFQISFNDPTAALTLNFDWRGTHEPADSIGLHRSPNAIGLASMHIEQLGLISGRLNYRGQDRALTGMGPRDHSLGIRQWENMHWYDLAWILMGDGRAFGLIQAQGAAGLVQIPWLWDGEQLLALSGMRFDKILDAENSPVSVSIEVADNLGRQYHLRGTRRTSLGCYFDGYVVHSGYSDFVLDDGTTGIGAVEYGYCMGQVH